MTPMSNGERKQPWTRGPRQGQTRHWRIGDRNLPRQVASQHRLSLFLPAMGWDHKLTQKFNPRRLRHTPLGSASNSVETNLDIEPPPIVPSTHTGAASVNPLGSPPVHKCRPAPANKMK